jgi:predicted transposase YbfD/YdcC
MDGGRRSPGEYRFPKLKAIAMIESRVETKAGTRTERRFYITSRAMTAKALGEAVRAHWQIENTLHWVLDVTFRDDLARVRKGYGAQNMALVRHFALNLVRQAKDKKSLKLRRKLASSHATGFEVLPKRWIVERTFAGLNRCRRLAKDFENLTRTALTFVRLASIRLMLRRLCNPS